MHQLSFSTLFKSTFRREECRQHQNMGMCSCGCRSTLSDTCSHIWGQTLKRRPKDKSCRSRLARKEHRLSHGHTNRRRCINGARHSDGEEKSVSVREDPGGGRSRKKKK